MKTKALAVNELPEDFKKDIESISKLADEKLLKLSKWTEQIEHLQDFDIEEDDLLEIQKSCDVSIEPVMSILRALAFATKIISRYDDEASDFVGDLVDKGIMPQSKSIFFLSALQKQASNFKLKPSVSSEYEFVLPVLKNSKTRCLALPTFDKEYSLKDDPDKYSGKVHCVLPAIILRLTLELPDDTEIKSFTVSESELDDLLKRLQLAKRQLSIFKAYLKV